MDRGATIRKVWGRGSPRQAKSTTKFVTWAPEEKDAMHTEPSTSVTAITPEPDRVGESGNEEPIEIDQSGSLNKLQERSEERLAAREEEL